MPSRPLISPMITMENEDGGAAVDEMSFYKDDAGRVSYNEKCLSCCRDCKQSYRAALIRCPGYECDKKMKP